MAVKVETIMSKYLECRSRADSRPIAKASADAWVAATERDELFSRGEKCKSLSARYDPMKLP